MDSFSSYKIHKEAKPGIEWEQEAPRLKNDFRRRVRRETVVGRSTVFHTSLEEWLEQQFNAVTVPRVGLHWLVGLCITRNCKYYKYFIILY